jgi:endonuclease/exonuclease/phosphatase family metal-dependent hydrolase
MTLRILTWNLKHGRSVPSAGHNLFDEFARALAGWEWDVALLQEVPPWWPAQLGPRLGASARLVLTSRNALLPVRRVIAERWPDAIKSNGGGSNAILLRSSRALEQRTMRLALIPERRWLHAVKLDDGIWVGNLHATVDDERAAVLEAEIAAFTTLRWAAGAPVVLGGDFNVRSLELSGFTRAGGHDVDHVFVAGLEPVAGPDVLDRGWLSDHAPVTVTVARAVAVARR